MYNRLSPSEYPEVGNLERVEALPLAPDLLWVQMHDEKGQVFDATINGRVLCGGDVLDAVHQNVQRSVRGAFQPREADEPDIDADTRLLSQYYGYSIDGRPTTSVMASSAWPR